MLRVLRVLRVLLRARYFHNWSGNRVTCRDWFQLTLKEGFTVYRDQHFTSDMTSAAVKRIEDARIIRSAQFTQDAGTPTRAAPRTKPPTTKPSTTKPSTGRPASQDLGMVPAY